MPSDVLITPASSKVEFTDGNNATKTLRITGTSFSFNSDLGIGITSPTSKLNVLSTTSLSSVFKAEGVNGTLFEVTDDLSNSLMSVNTIGGLPVFEVFANNTIVAGQYNANDFVISGNKVGVGTASPVELLDIAASANNAAIAGPKINFKKGSSNKAVIGIGGNYLGQATNTDDFIIRNDGANILFGFSGAEKVRFQTDGNVGIGTTTPIWKLDVSGTGVRSFATGAVEPGFIVDYDSTNGYGGFFIHTNGTRKWRIGNVGDTNSNPALFIWQEGVGARMYFKNNGQIGVGTSSPDGKFDVYENTNGGLVTTIRNVNSGSSVYTALFLGNNEGSNKLVMFTNSSTRTGDGGAGNSTIRTDSGKLYLGAGATQHILDTTGNVGIGNTSPNNKLAVSGSVSVGSNYNVAAPANGLIVEGSVGIGLTNPSYKFHVSGEIYSSTYINAATYFQTNTGQIKSDTSFALLTTGNGAQSVSAKGILLGTSYDTAPGANEIRTTNNTSLYLNARGTGDIQFQTADSLKMMLLNNGNVGIGTIVPAARLHINSATSGATLIRADGTNGTLFSVVDDLSDSLMSVNNSAGLPVLEVFADDRVVAGQYGQNDLVVINNKVGLGTNNPVNKLSVLGSVSIGSGYNTAAPTNGLIVQGDVGIGVTSFAFSSANRANLEMYGSGESLLALRNSTGNSYIQKSGADFYINNVTNGFIAISNNGSERWRITNAGVLQSNNAQTIQTSTGNLTLATAAGNGHIILTPHGTGNVGIGTATPSQKLEVQGNVKLNSVFGEGSTTGVTAFTHTVDSTQPSVYLWGKDHVTYPGQVHIIGRSDNVSANAGKIGFYDYNGTGWDLNMVINKNGNVGIGAIDPAAKLQINNAGDSRLIIYETGASPYTATLELSSQTYGTYGGVIQYDSSPETLTIQNYGRTATNSAQGSILFKTKINNTTATNVVIINGFTGNVGIATLSPSEKLEVVGVIKGTSFSGAGSGLTGIATSLTAGTVTTNANLTGPVTSIGNATTITDSAVTYAKIQNVSATRVLGRITASAGVVQELTGSDIATIIGVNAVTNAVTAGTANALNTANSYEAVSLNLTGTLQFGGNINWNHGVTTELGRKTISYNIWQGGKKLYADEDFNSGNNSISVYNNAGGSALTITRTALATAPNSSGQVLRVAYTPGSNGTSPGFGGFTFTTQTAANKVFVTRFVANIPTGRSLGFHSNAYGTNANSYWLTNNVGTGKWEEYVFVVMCGNTGSFSSTNFFAISGGADTAFSWDIASATVFDVTNKRDLVSSNFESYQSSNALTFNYLATNLNVNNPVPIYAFDVTSGAETRSIKAGLGYERHLTNGRGTLHIYNRSTDDTTNITGLRASAGDIKVSIDNAGNVGLGITIPSSKLHVFNSAGSSTIASNAIAVFEQNSNAGIQVCVPDASEAGLFFSRSGAAYYSAITRNGTDLLLKNNSATAVTINSNGNVGVGITDPTAKLDVTGSNVNGYSLLLRSGDNYNGTDSVQIAFGFANQTNYRHSIRTRHNPAAPIGGVVGNNIDFYVWKRGTDAAADLGSQFVMTMQGDGNVGIGVTNPVAVLNVKTSTQQNREVFMGDSTAVAGVFRARLDDNSLSFISLENRDLAATTDHGVGIRFNLGTNASDNAINAGGIYLGKEQQWTATASTQDSYLAFATSLDGTANEKVRIKSDGNVGIGITNPAYKLDVNGTCNVSDYLTIKKDLGFPISNTSAYFGYSVAVSSSAGSLLELVHSLSGSIGVNDPLRFRSILSAQESNDGVTYTTEVGPPSYSRLIDGNASSNVDIFTFDEYNSGIRYKRFVVDIGSSYRRPNFITIQSDYGGNLFYGYTVLIERSVDNSTWTTACSTQTQPNNSSRILAFNLGDLFDARYIRFTFGASQAITSGGVLKINCIRSYSNQYYSSEIPVFTDSSANLYSKNSNFLATASGSVGIGITSPITKLHVYSPVAGAGSERTTPIDVLTLESENTTAQEFTGFGQAIVFRGSTYNNNTQRTLGKILHQINDDSVSTTRGTSLDFQLLTDATGSTLASRMYIKYDGNVGIGTNTPIQKLHIVGSTLITNNNYHYGYTVAGAQSSLIGISSADNILVGQSNANHANTIIYGGLGVIDLNTSGFTRMRVTYDGNVGIGTTSPVTKLHVEQVQNAESLITLRNDRQDLADVPIFGISAQNNITNVAKISFYRGGGGNSGYLTFSTKFDNTSSLTEKVRIDGAGNVGIGTTSPSSKLHISNAAAATRITITDDIANGRSGYIESNYSDALVIGTTSGVRSIRFAPDNSIAMTIAVSTNNVGINLLSPNNKLAVSGSASIGSNYNVAAPTNGLIVEGGVAIATTSAFTTGGTAQLSVSTNTNAVALSIGASNTDMSYIRRLSTAVFQWQTYNGTNAGQIQLQPYGGNVGIGLTAPTAKLNVLSSTSLSSVFKAEGINGTLFEVTDDLSNSLMSVNTIGGLPVFEVFANNTIIAGQYNANDLVITGNKVGVGTATPSYKLQVNHSSGYGIVATDGTVSSGIYNGTPIGGVTGAYFGTISNHDAIFGSYGVSGGYVIVKNNGNVGIGTTNPGYKLDVNGSFRTVAGNLTLFNDYIYVSPTNANTLNSAYNTNGIADMWVNFRGYQDLQTQFRNFNVGDGKGGNIAWFDGTNKRMSLNNGQAASYTLHVNGTAYINSTLQVNSNITLSGGGDVIINDSDGTGFFASFMDSGVGYIRIDDGGTANGTLNINSGTLFVGPSSGSVGIGSNTPNNKLSVLGSVSVGSNYNVAAPANGLIVEGSVGIGVTSPDANAKLHVYGNDAHKYIFYTDSAGSSSTIFQRNNTAESVVLTLANTRGPSVGTDRGTSLNLDLGYGGSSASAGTLARGAKISAFSSTTYTSTASTQNAYLAFYTALAGSLTEKMRIDSNGNVGIGTVSPSTTLHLNSTISGATLLRADGTNGTLFSVVDDLSDSLMSVNNSAGLPVLEVFADDRVVAGQYGKNDFVINANKIGIGTTNPTSQLEVGNVNTSGTGITVSARYDQSEAYIRFRTGHPNNSNVWETANISATDGGNYNGTLSFRTAVSSQSSPSTKMTILPNGNVGIGTAAPATLLQINTGTPTSATGGIQFGDDTAARIYRVSSSTIQVSNNLTVGGTLTESSSIRYKENIKTISAPILSKLEGIRPVTYNKKDNPDNTEYGIIAEELNEIFPEFVNKNDDGEIESVNYSRLTVLLIKAVKELKQEIDILKNK